MTCFRGRFGIQSWFRGGLQSHYLWIDCLLHYSRSFSGLGATIEGLLGSPSSQNTPHNFSPALANCPSSVTFQQASSDDNGSDSDLTAGEGVGRRLLVSNITSSHGPRQTQNGREAGPSQPHGLSGSARLLRGSTCIPAPIEAPKQLKRASSVWYQKYRAGTQPGRLHSILLIVPRP